MPGDDGILTDSTFGLWNERALGLHPLAAVVEDDDAGADVFCAPTEEPARFDIFDNDREAKSIVQRISNPMMLLRDIMPPESIIGSTAGFGHLRKARSS